MMIPRVVVKAQAAAVVDLQEQRIKIERARRSTAGLLFLTFFLIDKKLFLFYLFHYQ